MYRTFAVCKAEPLRHILLEHVFVIPARQEYRKAQMLAPKGKLRNKLTDCERVGEDHGIDTKAKHSAKNRCVETAMVYTPHALREERKQRTTPRELTNSSVYPCHATNKGESETHATNIKSFRRSVVDSPNVENDGCKTCANRRKEERFLER